MQVQGPGEIRAYCFGQAVERELKTGPLDNGRVQLVADVA